MPQTVYEAARSIPVLDEVGVLVAGGGVAGCAAAYAAAKAGAKTTLIERNGCLGGVATATLMANIGNRLITATGEQVVRGFAGEAIDRLIAVGGASPQWDSRDVPGCVIDSERLKVVLIEMLEDAGVTILTHVLAARPILQDASVRGCFIESKSSRQAILARATLDCTGEADIAWQAGAEVSLESGTSSTLFKLANVDTDAFVAFLNEDPDGFPAGMDWVKDLGTFNRNWEERGILFFPHGGGRNWRFMQDAIAAGEFETAVDCAQHLEALGMYALRGTGFIVINSNFYKVEDLDIRSLAKFEVHAQKMCYYVADFLKRRVPGFGKADVAHIGVDLGVRASRYIYGRSVLNAEHLHDAPAATRFDDVIGTTPVQDSTRACGEFFKPYATDVPFGVCVPRGCENLLVGSAKSIYTQPKALIRGMSGCMVCGQAVGAAGALSASQDVDASDVPIRDLQRELLDQGVHLGDAARLAELGLT